MLVDKCSPVAAIPFQVLLKEEAELVCHEVCEGVQQRENELRHEEALPSRCRVLCTVHHWHDGDAQLALLIALPEELLLQVNNVLLVHVPRAARVAEVCHVHKSLQKHSPVLLASLAPLDSVFRERVVAPLGHPRRQPIHKFEVVTHVRRQDGINHLSPETLVVLFGHAGDEVHPRPPKCLKERAGVHVLQRRPVVVHDGQRCPCRDQERVVDARVPNIMCQSTNE
mmetsp:Transcript_59573/g.153415  ORF Transcript_59573/g.153415 Transcript_59573/m.153415 type:complete len:226 (+) Transcript_59573:169-846(+)